MKKDPRRVIKIAGKVIDSWLPLKIGYDHTPGAVVCIAQNGVPIYVRAFGVSDIVSRTPMLPDSQFRVASMSKMFTAVAVMQLQERGKLRLDDKVVTYLPWFQGKRKKIDLSNVTIRQLLSHQSGIWRDGDEHQWINDTFPRDLTNTMTQKSGIFENATTFKYSNHGYAVLGLIIETVAAATYEDYCFEEIIRPLKLKNTFADLPAVVPKKLVHGYVRWVPGMSERVSEPHIKTHAYAPATGFISDVNDLAVFLASLNIESKKSVLSRESRKAMVQVHGLCEEKERYGLGLALDIIADQATYGHSGGFPGYVSNAVAVSESNLQVIVLTNTQSRTAGQVSDGVVRLVSKLSAMPDALYTEDEPYSGVYRSRWGDTAIVSLGDQLVAFSSAVGCPTQDWTMYKKEKRHVFRNTKKSGFGNPGETIWFVNHKNGKAEQAVTDADVSQRIL
jgi:D-alanyl-D-alanine carboxypeptidase